MKVSARIAQPEDLDVLTSLYGGLEKEMEALHPMWPLADGFAEPIGQSIEEVIDDPSTVVVIGEIDEYPFGFLVAFEEELLPQAGSEIHAAIRYVFVDHEARQVAVGEAMLDLAMGEMRRRGITKFDAHVLPGHRLAKNFFESGGFSARSIVMHHDDERE